jgi:transposase
MILKRGKSIEITKQLTPEVAMIISQWIGGYTVIKNQKTLLAKDEYTRWLVAGKPENSRPKVNTQVAYLNQDLPFLKDIPSQIRRNAGAKWFEAMNAAKSGLRQQPTVRKKHQKRNCYVTNELFTVQALEDDRCVIQLKNNAMKGVKGRVVAGFVMPFSKESAGNALYLSRQGARFWLSMSHDKVFDVPTQQALKAQISSLDDEALITHITGYDLGVVRQVTGSSGQVYHFDDHEMVRLKQLTVKTKRYQRKVARITRGNDRHQGTARRKRTKVELAAQAKVTSAQNKHTHVCHNHAHHISKAIAEDTPLIGVFENMKIANLIRAPKVKVCPETGKWLRNGRSAKRGLNKALAMSTLGKIRQFSQYKLEQEGKLFITVKTAYSSQECAECGFIAKENRPSNQCFIASNVAIKIMRIIMPRRV